ncbi:N-acetylmuramoyl-L-alanine amidase [Nonomuraea guangzhouensis]|uniref:N-acetylmuramoyl-L-alanine amidase n=1 Tax=Nonomuraea guangzhouensis TaxID=1291555 RepID=A0ABW4GEU2_9ACTN|nr:N-acetylmuramoyl-L-alanine amidase [Nonomuraea guangzhouensis]
MLLWVVVGLTASTVAVPGLPSQGGRGLETDVGHRADARRQTDLGRQADAGHRGDARRQVDARRQADARHQANAGHWANARRQGDFAAAARDFGVPESVLLGLSYLESRWDANAGTPSVAGGYGPMHLVDAPLRLAQRLTGLPAARLRTDPAANIRGGAAVLASYQRRPSTNPADWYDAVARYAGAPGPQAARAFADEVFAVIRAGAARRTDDGQPVRLTAIPALFPPARPNPLHPHPLGPSLLDPGPLSPSPLGPVTSRSAAHRVADRAPSTSPETDRDPSASPEPDAHDPAQPVPGQTADPARPTSDQPQLAAGPGRSTTDQTRPTAGPGRTTTDETRPPAGPGRPAGLTQVASQGDPPPPPETDTDEPAAGEGRASSPAPPRNPNIECPASLACEWMPAAYKRTDTGGYGNHDTLNHPRRIDYIVIHDTEGTYAGVPSMVHDPKYVSWHYTIRSSDGHVAQHVRTKDIAWHSGNWDVNARSIGIEHEGYLAKGGTWYTEAMYIASAKLVKYLAAKHDIPLDRAHILGHDNVPGSNPTTLASMHEDPGPYWDWAHYFDLLGSPLKPAKKGTSVIIRPNYDANQPQFTGCFTKPAKAGKPCPPHGASSVWLRTEPREDAPLVDDIGKRVGKPSTYSVYDHSARASTGQRYAVAGRSGDWTAIWYLGTKAWFYNPGSAPNAIRARGPLVTPLRKHVKVYGLAYPGQPAYRRKGVTYQAATPLNYVIQPGQYYSLGLTLHGSYQAAKSFNPAGHVMVKGKARYHQIQFGHRVMYVMAKDVRVIH